MPTSPLLLTEHPCSVDSDFPTGWGDGYQIVVSSYRWSLKDPKNERSSISEEADPKIPTFPLPTLGSSPNPRCSRPEQSVTVKFFPRFVGTLMHNPPRDEMMGHDTRS